MFARFTAISIAAALALLGLAAPAFAQDRDTPYWASLRFDEVNMRVGPSQEYPIEWVYKRKGLPVKVIRLREGWRLVRDPEGDEGWVAASQLNPERGVIVIGKGLVEIREDPNPAAPLKWRAEPGVVARLLRCDEGWCEVVAEGRKGWMLEDRLWGAGEPRTK